MPDGTTPKASGLFFEKKVRVLVAQLCPILCDPMDCSPSGSSVHRVLQARILEWVAIPFSRDIPNSGIKPQCPALQAGSLRSDPPGKLSEFPLKKKKKKTNHAPPFPQFSSVAQSCPTLCNPMNSSTPPCPSPSPRVHSNSCPSSW